MVAQKTLENRRTNSQMACLTPFCRFSDDAVKTTKSYIPAPDLGLMESEPPVWSTASAVTTGDDDRKVQSLQSHLSIINMARHIRYCLRHCVVVR